MNRITVDGKELTSPKALHATLKNALSFPDYYGGNLDALFDALTDIHEVTCVVIENSADAKANLGEYFWRFMEVFTDAQAKYGDERLRLLLM